MISTALCLAAFAAGANDAVLELGERLFHDTRFGSSAADMSASCAACHMPADPQGDRAFTQDLAKSWHPWRREDPTRDTLRNSPTLFDTAAMPALHYDGEFASLEEQAAKTFVGRNFGWLPGERDAALAKIRDAVVSDTAYPGLFRRAFDCDVSKADREKLLDCMADATAKFMRTLESPRTTPYDVFMRANGLDESPADGETPKTYGARILAAIEDSENRAALRRPAEFDDDALAGLKIFLRTSGNDRAGNCVACHVPPFFSDFAFHNTGVTQDEYERLHGAESFMKYPVPPRRSADAPAPERMSVALQGRPELADLGYWNYAKPNAENGAEEEFFERAIASFKTPTLRHLGSTSPYMHNGLYATIESAVHQKIRAAFLARMGQLRNADPELLNIRIMEDDIRPLFAFLNALNEPGGRRATPSNDVLPAEGTKAYVTYSPEDQE
ncbi:MAG: cytochrome c peroxidase [Candidatus Hydrogenedentota bacterium]